MGEVYRADDLKLGQAVALKFLPESVDRDPARLMQIHAEVRMAVYRTWLRWPPRHPPYVAYQVPETSGPTRIVSPRFLQYAHEHGLGVQVWTVDEEADMRRLLSWGTDGLITNRPDLGVRVRDAWRAA